MLVCATMFFLKCMLAHIIIIITITIIVITKLAATTMTTKVATNSTRKKQDRISASQEPQLKTRPEFGFGFELEYKLRAKVSQSVQCKSYRLAASVATTVQYKCTLR